MKIKSLFILILSVFIFISCEDDDENLNSIGTVSFSLEELVEVENATAALAINIGIDDFNHAGGTVSVSINGGDYGVDYETSTGSNTFILEVSPQSLVVNFSILPIDNEEIEGDLPLTITITEVSGALELGEQNTLVFTILDNDNPLISLVGFENETQTIEENSTTQLIANILFDQATTDGGTLNITSSGDAIFGTDYTINGQTSGDFTLTVPGGASSASFEIEAIDNAVFEADKMVAFTIAEVSGGLSLGVVTTTTITIVNDDASPNPIVDFNASNTLTYNEDAGTITLNFDISQATTADATIELTASGTADMTDYNFGGSNSPYSFVIPSGSTSGSVAITIIDDAETEDNETIVLDITSVSGGLDAGLNLQQQTLTITDNDAVVFNYVEDFESGTDLATLGFENILNGQTVDPSNIIGLINSGGNFTDVNDFTLPSDNGLNIFYNAGSGASPELLDNVLVSPLMEASGNMEVIIDNAYAFKNQNSSTVTYYWSQTYNGSGTFNEADWNVMGTETVANMNGEGFGNNDYKQQSYNINPTGDFYVAIRVAQNIDATFYRTRWRFDNLKINSL